MISSYDRFSVRKGVSKMKLMTKKLEKRFKEVGTQEKVKDPVIVAKFFNPGASFGWHVTEYDRDRRTFFGFCLSSSDSKGIWGFFTLKELRDYKDPFGNRIEQDLNFGEKRVSEVLSPARGRYSSVRFSR
jgi:hypothetical protein